MSLTRLYRRTSLRTKRIGIGHPKKKEDLCPICFTWDQRTVKDMQASTRLALQELGQAYWKDCKDFMMEHPPYDSPEIRKALQTYINDMNAGDHLAMQLAEAKALKVFAKHQEEAEHWQVHLALRDHFKQKLQDDLDKPLPEHLSIWSDWKETLPSKSIIFLPGGFSILRGCKQPSPLPSPSPFDS